MKQTAEIQVSGIVQGVGFRYTAQKLAQMHGIGGSVMNLLDGRVQIDAYGTKPQIDAFCDAIRTSRLGAGIEHWEESRHPASDGPPGFHIRPDWGHV